MKGNYPYQQAQQGIVSATTGYLNIGQAAQSQTASRLTVLAGRLQGQVANYAGFVDRLCRVADRLSGVVPEAVGDQNKINSPFDAISQRLNAVIERLEAL
jgi:hypothetical protein